MAAFNFKSLEHWKGMILISLPPTPSVAPFGALGYLGGMAKYYGAPCQLLDLGVDFTNWVLSAKQLSRLTAGKKVFNVPIKLRAGVIGEVTSDEIVSRIDEALQVIRKPYNNFEEHSWATQLIRTGFTLYSQDKHGEVELGYYSHPWSGLDLNTIYDQLLTEADLFTEFLEEVVPLILVQKYEVVALSIQHTDQVVPAMSLAKALRAGSFGGKILAGGVQVSYLISEIEKEHNFFRYIDAFSPKMGEPVLRSLFEYIKGKIYWAQIPNLYVKTATSKIGFTGNYREPILRQLPPPDFSGLCFESYLVPEVTLPLRTATKCYWGKCKFCRITSDALFDNLGILSAKELYSQMQYLHRVNGAKHFIMADDATPPTVLTKLSELIIKNGDQFRWTAIGIIPEKYIDMKVLEIWARGGCASIAIGFESGSERMLKIMGKSNNLKHIEWMLEVCRQLQIITFCYGFYGHPLETKEDLIQTFEFKKRNQRVATYFSAGRWLLSPYSIDYKEIDKLGIALKEPATFPLGKEYWLEWDSPRREEHERDIAELQMTYNHHHGTRNHLSDWIYWGQGSHIPYDWTLSVNTISF